MQTLWLAACTALLACPWVALAEIRPEAICALDLPATSTQGGLVIGHVDPHCVVTVNGRRLRIDSSGVMAFGFGRDAASKQTVKVSDPSTKAHYSQSITLEQRQYKIEKVNGVPPSTVNPDPKLQERINREQAEVVRARQRDDARLDFTQGFILPVQGRISGVYGSQRILNGTPKSPHYGLDIAAPTGKATAAPAAGIITFAKPDLYLTGGTLVIDHGHGISSTFIHLSRIDVKVGQRVEQGEIVGAVGMTGRASGPHLHWAMNWFGERLDPQLLAEDRD